MKKIYLETFGCQMNVLDSELVENQLRALGYGFTPAAEEADVVLYNTCSVREHAEQKVWSRLGELRDRKREQPELVIGVIGCMAERDGTNLFQRNPHVDVLCGPGELDKLAQLVHNAVVTNAAPAGGGKRQRHVAHAAGRDGRQQRAGLLQGRRRQRRRRVACVADRRRAQWRCARRSRADRQRL